MFACYDGPVDSFGACKFGYFDLQIPARNPLEEDIDLTGLKWDKIAEDLYEFTGLTFDSTKLEVKYAWKGDSKMVISDGNDKLVKRIKLMNLTMMRPWKGIPVSHIPVQILKTIP